MAYIASLNGDYLKHDKMLDVFVRNGYNASPTDFALLLGLDDVSNRYETGGSLKRRYSRWWSTEANGNGLNVTTEGNIVNITHHMRNYRCFGERPVIYDYDDILDIDDDTYEIEYGEYPQYAASKELQDILEEKHSYLSITKKEYTTDGSNPNSYDLPYHPEILTEYVYKGKKYVRVRSRGNGILSNGIEIFKNLEPPQYIWIEVSPIKWLVDHKEKILLSKKILLSGLRHKRILRSNIPKWFTSSDYFLDRVFSQEIEILEDKTKEKKDPKDKIVMVLESIREYKKYYDNHLDIEDKISIILNEYNSKLDELINKKTERSLLVLNQVDATPNKLHQELLGKLGVILTQVKAYTEKVLDYYIMLDTLSECKYYLDKTDYDHFLELLSDKKINELCRYIIAIRYILCHVSDDISDKLIKELREIIDKSINRNKAYIKEFKLVDELVPKTLYELELEFRSDLHPYLIKLSEAKDKYNMVSEIIRTTSARITQVYRETKNERVNFLLHELEKAKETIYKYGTKEEQENLEKELKIDINYDEDTMSILNKLEMLLVIVNRLSFDIMERKNKSDSINIYKIDEKYFNKK